MRRPRIPALLAMASLSAAAALLAAPAQAEPVRLRSGSTLEARTLQVDGEVLVLTLDVGAAQGRLRLPFAQVDPGDLLRVLSSRTRDDDAPGQLRLALLALQAGQHAQAVDRATRAGMLSAALRPAQTEILGAVRQRETEAVLAEIELDLRLGQPLAARARARLLLDESVPVEPPYLLAERAQLLLRLAEQLALQAAGAPLSGPVDPAASPAQPSSPQPSNTQPSPGASPVPAGTADGPGEPPLPAGALDALALAARAEQVRERAADPALSPPQREALLSEAAGLLLDARRLLLTLPGPLSASVTWRLDALRTLLVATWLDLADLARGARAPEVALDRVQAALVLDPESERAWELRRWIERDLSAAYLSVPLGPVTFEGAWGSYGGGGFGRAWGAGPGCGCHGGLSGAVRIGGSRSGGGGSHHAGTRR